jgi:hypothetical protein
MYVSVFAAFLVHQPLPTTYHNRPAISCPLPQTALQLHFQTLSKRDKFVLHMSTAPPRKTVRLAWVGNSFVYYNNLPQMLACLLKYDGINFKQKRVLVGGQSLHGHSQDPSVSNLLAQNQWDYVVLQDNSAVPGGCDEHKLNESITALRDVFSPLLPKSGSGRVLLYSSWGHKVGSPVLEKYAEQYPSFEVMNEKTAAGYCVYKTVLKQAFLDVAIVPVGRAFSCVYQSDVEQGRDPDAPLSLFSRLFAPDSFHPSPLGTFLSACVFHHIITGDFLFFNFFNF